MTFVPHLVQTLTQFWICLERRQGVRGRSGFVAVLNYIIPNYDKITIFGFVVDAREAGEDLTSK